MLGTEAATAVNEESRFGRSEVDGWKDDFTHANMSLAIHIGRHVVHATHSVATGGSLFAGN